MVLEATRILAEKVVRDARDVDLGLIYGIGFPPFKGGLVVLGRYARRSSYHRAAEAFRSRWGLASSRHPCCWRWPPRGGDSMIR